MTFVIEVSPTSGNKFLRTDFRDDPLSISCSVRDLVPLSEMLRSRDARLPALTPEYVDALPLPDRLCFLTDLLDTSILIDDNTMFAMMA